MNSYDGSFFDRNGKAITMKQWCAESNSKHAFYKEAKVNGIRVITKWTGVDLPEYDWMQEHNFSMRSWKPPHKPLIFVSYAFNEDNEIVKSRRYAKIEHAYAGHADLIAEMEQIDFGVYYVPVTQLEEVNG